MHKQSSLLILIIISFFLTFGSSYAIPDPLIVININNTENVTFANHSNTVSDGNWIELYGGTPITIPTLNLIYNGIDSKNYSVGGKNINITVAVDNYSDFKIIYPFTEHSIYTNLSGKKEVNISFYGSNDFANQGVDIYLISTMRSTLENIFDDLYDGDTQSFRDLLNRSTNTQYNSSLNVTGDNTSITFGEIDAGSYVILVLQNSTYPTNPTILSGTIIEVLEYDSILSAPTSANIGDIINVSIAVNSSQANYTYGFVLFHSDSYQTDLKLSYNGTKDSINLTANTVDLITGFDLVTINKTTAINIATDIIGTNNGWVRKVDPSLASNSTYQLINTGGFRSGKYYLMVGVYKSGELLVALNQSEITLSSPPSGSSGSSGGGGGGGGGTGENNYNIESYENSRKFVYQDQLTSFNYSYNNNIVKYLNFTGEGTLGKLLGKVEMLYNPSTLVDIAPTGEIYKNFNVWIGFKGWFSSDHVSNPTLTFTVEKLWISKNNIKPDSISLYFYNVNKWDEVSTQKIDEDSSNYYFKANLPITGSLGPMAVSGQTGLVGTSKPTSIPARTPNIKIIPTKKPLTLTEESIPGFQMIFALFAIILLYFIGKRRN